MMEGGEVGASAMGDEFDPDTLPIGAAPLVSAMKMYDKDYGVCGRPRGRPQKKSTEGARGGDFLPPLGDGFWEGVFWWGCGQLSRCRTAVVWHSQACLHMMP
jgi:hypothetical protein